MDAPTGSWPLSAAATALLQNPRTRPSEVMKLTLKELVLRRVWRVERTTSWLRDTVWLDRGDRPVPPLAPLPVLDEALRQSVPDGGGSVRSTIRHALALDGRLEDRLRDDAREELVSRALMSVERRKVLGLFSRTVATTTASGESWLMDVAGREASLRAAIGRTSRELAPQMAALGGLVLLLDPPTIADVEDAVRRLRDDPGVTGGWDAPEAGVLDDAGALDLSDVGALDALDSGLDSAIDTGVADGGSGGGDGGGGDGGGGGGG